eukprot:CAMPEP_0182422462 /NCGR_PEP_ID=MMETSP1167-20130531/8175_1 /TAXON_ID=2988 /ORGANISM="Mallomonas Sp, Strain CCMP3275" /LENGTH=140 /DNA_ID=CAMNT_0024600559 /DNA_START=240 /DNA_END=662 /DNA_ORIENTATION=+
MDLTSELNISIPDEATARALLLSPACRRSTAMYQEGRTRSNHKIVRSRVQSTVYENGDAAAMLDRIGYAELKDWEQVGIRLHLLSGVSVSIMCADVKSAKGQPYYVEIVCASSDAKVDLAHERTASVAISLANYLILPDS